MATDLSEQQRLTAQDWSIVIPVLNDSAALAMLLAEVTKAPFQIVVSDGGSTDETRRIAAKYGAEFVAGAPGRGQQLDRGVSASTRPWVWLLHADSQFQLARLLDQLTDLDEPAWGRFDIALQPSSWPLAAISWFMNWRSRLTKICTGDQGIFVHRDLLLAVGGVPSIPLMEDIQLSSRLKRLGAPFVALPGLLISSSRRWRHNGLVQTVLFMWWCRLRFWFGVSAQRLADEYYCTDDA